MKNIIIVIVVLLMVGLGGYLLFGSNSSGESCTVDTAIVFGSIGSVATSSADISDPVIIIFNNGEVTPSCVKVSQGAEIKWLNAGDENIQIGADPHPVHTGNKEVSYGGFVLDMAPSEEKTFTINKVGKTGYHDHLDSSVGGVIIVD